MTCVLMFQPYMPQQPVALFSITTFELINYSRNHSCHFLWLTTCGNQKFLYRNYAWQSQKRSLVCILFFLVRCAIGCKAINRLWKLVAIHSFDVKSYIDMIWYVWNQNEKQPFLYLLISHINLNFLQNSN